MPISPIRGGLTTSSDTPSTPAPAPNTPAETQVTTSDVDKNPHQDRHSLPEGREEVIMNSSEPSKEKYFQYVEIVDEREGIKRVQYREWKYDNDLSRNFGYKSPEDEEDEEIDEVDRGESQESQESEIPITYTDEAFEQEGEQGHYHTKSSVEKVDIEKKMVKMKSNDWNYLRLPYPDLKNSHTYKYDFDSNTQNISHENLNNKSRLVGCPNTKG